MYGFGCKQLDAPTLQINYVSKDEKRFPQLNVKVIYALQDDKCLKKLWGYNRQPTVVTWPNHLRNWMGGQCTILNNLLQIDADKLYTGWYRRSLRHFSSCSVPIWFTKATAIGARIEQPTSTKKRKGYDHNFVLNKHGLIKPSPPVNAIKAALVMEVIRGAGHTVYSGNFMKVSILLKVAQKDDHRTILLRTQHYPDSPNQPSFPTTTLLPARFIKREYL